MSGGQESNPSEYLVSYLGAIGRTYRFSWKDHILEVDHYYGGDQRAWGTTLCGRVGKMVRHRVYRGLDAVGPRLGHPDLCRTCKRVAERSLAAGEL